jgi:protein-tyrosine phosphatase
VARRHGVDISQQRSRPLTTRDLEVFDFIVAMDRRNALRVEAMGGFPPQRLLLARRFDPESFEHDVPDPWAGDARGFDEVFGMLARATDPLIEHMVRLGRR